MVRFWDTSALVPLLVAERETARAERWLREDAGVIVWALTRVEPLSALARRRRQEPAAARRERLSAWERWSEGFMSSTITRRDRGSRGSWSRAGPRS
jgi:uncharacterized protein with PIN domain